LATYHRPVTANSTSFDYTSSSPRFGYSLEAKAAKQLKNMQVFVSHFGLDLTRSPATWPFAIEIDGAQYNLKSGPIGAQYELARPIILRNETGEIIGGRARSRSEAKQTAENLIRKGMAKEIKIEESPGENLNDVTLSVDLSYNEDLYRFSAKLVGNVAIAMGREVFIKESGIGLYLHGRFGWSVCIANCDTSATGSPTKFQSHRVRCVWISESRDRDSFRRNADLRAASSSPHAWSYSRIS
jgi:hypothetical protein